MSRDDTIAAPATPAGASALAVVRLSGPRALAIADRVDPHPRPAAERLARLVSLEGPDGPIDTALVTRFHSPRSYTGEDLVEFSVHGNPLLTRRLLDALIHHGARLARPGEFTQRALLHHKLDFTAAEAVMDLIGARTDAAVRGALAVQRGGLRDRATALRDLLVATLAHLEAYIDFPDEDIEPATRDALLASIHDAAVRTRRLLDTHAAGRLLREGARIVLAGAPNTGKSSLLNALLGRDRAIVHHTPGTTRDTIESECVIEGIAVHLTDTAGLRDSSDPVEQQGVQRSEEAIATADLVLHVFAADAGWTPADDALAARLPSDRTLRVCNKADLAPAPDGAALAVSALTGAGLHALRVRIGREVTQGAAIPEDGVTVNARHAGCLTRTADALEAASRALNEGLAPEFIAIELRDALRGLDDITGITTNEDVLDALFRRFCIGK